MFGCDLPHLSEAERAHCADRLAANRPTTPAPFNFDPHAHYVGAPALDLARMPKTGCKVRASGDSVEGQHGVAIGVGCGWAF